MVCLATNQRLGSRVRFIAAERDGELIGGGSIVAYGERFGFMGFFIVRPEDRRQGLGRQLWLARRDRLIARLRAPAVIGMDGVFTMQDFYVRGGFVLSHRDRRFEGVGVAALPDAGLVDLREAPFDALGQSPVGWYTGRVSPNTRRLLVEAGGFLYDSDAYDDERPYWLTEHGQSHLVIPYSLVTNDIRYLLAPGCATADDFFDLLRAAFDWMWMEGQDRPGVLSVGLHARISGHPARAVAVARFLDYAAGHDGVWICRRREIAEHWIRHCSS